MKLYYIDDSMFQRSHFAQQTLSRFEHYIKQNAKNGIIFVSSSGKESLGYAFEYFCEAIKNMTVLVSPSLFDIEGIRGNLHSTFLAVEGFPSMQPYSGTFVEYDSETNICRRIYVDLFIDHDTEVDYIVQEMEQLLAEKFQQLKKKKSMS